MASMVRLRAPEVAGAPAAEISFPPRQRRIPRLVSTNSRIHHDQQARGPELARPGVPTGPRSIWTPDPEINTQSPAFKRAAGVCKSRHHEAVS